MKKIVIATHGKLAKGFANTLEILGIELTDIMVMNFYCGEDSTQTQVKECFEALQEQEQLIVCTDIQFGSVNQMFLKEASRHPNKDVNILTGVNLPLLLEIATSQEPLSKQALLDMVHKASSQLTLVDLEELKASIKEEDIF